MTGVQTCALPIYALRLEIPGYETIEAPLPEDMQSLVAQLRAQKKDKEPVLTDRDED